MSISYRRRIFCFIVLVLALCWPNATVYAAKSEANATAPMKLDGWQYRIGDSPVLPSGVPAWASETLSGTHWKPIEHQWKRNNFNGKRHIWLKIKLPERIWRDPSLVVQIYQNYEIYFQGRKLYSHGTFDSEGNSRYQGTPVRIVSLPVHAPGETIFIRIFSASDYIGLLGNAEIGSRSDFIVNTVKKETHKWVLGFLYIIAGIISICLFLNRFRIHKPYLSFGLFAVCFGLYTLCRTDMIYLFYDSPLFWTYAELASLFLAMTGMIAFIEHLFGFGTYRILRRLRQMHLSYSVVSLCLSALDVVSVPTVLLIYQIFLIASMACVLVQLSLYAVKGNNEARFVLVGMSLFCLFGLVDIIDNMQHSSFDTPNVSYIGSFLFIATLFIILLRRLFIIMVRLGNTEKLSVVGQLAAGVAHEIRNPVTVISGFLQLLKKDTSSKAYMDIMLSEIKRIDAIMSEFLLLAKPNEIKFEEHEPKRLLQDVLLLFDQQASNSDIDLRFHCSDDIPAIHCEPNQLKQVFINMIKNAMEAMPNGGEITIIMNRINADSMQIRFMDQGIGIDEKDLSKIGDPFYTTKSDGTGLGFMVSRNIIENHNGRIRMQSKVGVGTTIDIELPMDCKKTKKWAYAPL